MNRAEKPNLKKISSFFFYKSSEVEERRREEELKEKTEIWKKEAHREIDLDEKKVETIKSIMSNFREPSSIYSFFHSFICQMCQFIHLFICFSLLALFWFTRLGLIDY